MHYTTPMKTSVILTGLLILFCTACSPITMERNVVYGVADGQKLVLDIYHPMGMTGLRPALLFVHGGGWAAGSKETFGDAPANMAKQGYVTFAINYRLIQNGKNLWPAQLDDVQRAIRWIRAHATDYHVDPERIGAIGHSAGGHLVACLATRETRDNADPTLSAYSSRVTCAVDMSGPVDLTVSDNPQADGIIAALLGGKNTEKPALARDASPLFFVDAMTAPVLIIHGRCDTLVAVRHAEQFDAALRRAGIETQALIFPDEGHGLTKKENTARMISDVLAFLKKHLNP